MCRKMYERDMNIEKCNVNLEDVLEKTAQFFLCDVVQGYVDRVRCVFLANLQLTEN